MNEYGFGNYTINNEYYAALTNRYTPKELLSMARYVGYFGDEKDEGEKETIVMVVL